ncbi:predicted protein [Phaeodactylum tricornutum CCAP 1055/1]|uniref:Uncharacterized protein n=1 Tax=Phaeodactylum tricornutum (strain CCAP 1055/1) TaxID=556484 RepID=B7G464_PHATC|nr:predicted protein [Phaeodactylum tricornutum CCAP 1055/1]EEC46558.1 predicted protein [Phaeodactylum tricornutum CCAP 1055/1]|eukprot:XP_002182018.1 predicted protein [Phaeodactylum tricornutum CCAP 1055/1]
MVSTTSKVVAAVLVMGGLLATQLDLTKDASVATPHANAPSKTTARGLKGARRLASGATDGYGSIDAVSTTGVYGSAGAGVTKQEALVNNKGSFVVTGSAGSPGGSTDGSAGVAIDHAGVESNGYAYNYGVVDPSVVSATSGGTGYFVGSFDTDATASLAPGATEAPTATPLVTSSPTRAKSAKAKSPKAKSPKAGTPSPKSTMAPEEDDHDDSDSEMNIEVPSKLLVDLAEDEATPVPESGSAYAAAGGSFTSTLTGGAYTTIDTPYGATAVPGATVVPAYALGSGGVDSVTVDAGGAADSTANDFTASADAEGGAEQDGSFYAYNAASINPGATAIPVGEASIYADIDGVFGTAGEAGA